jgi:hypothetical protein
MAEVKRSALEQKKKDEEQNKKARKKRQGHPGRVKQFTKGSDD